MRLGSKLARQTAQTLQASGVQIEVRRGDIFSGFTRETDARHIFFIDLLGICAFGNYVELFGAMFQNLTIRENDCLMITSFLPPRVGWSRVYQAFDGEFRLFVRSTVAEKQQCYMRLHPSFTLYRALQRVDLQDTLSLTCFGGVAYASKSPMGVYGYTIGAGETRLTDFACSPWHASSYG